MSVPRDWQEAYHHAPYDLDIEQATIGCLMRNKALIDEACADINGDHFYDRLHGRIFDMMVALHADGDTPTPLVLHSVMKSDPGLLETGGVAYLEALWAAAPAIVTLRQWVNILLDLHVRRQVQEIAAGIAEEVVTPANEMSGRVIAERATEALLQIGRLGGKPILSIREIAEERTREVEAARSGAPIPRVLTGLHKMDKEIGGLRGGHLIVVMGKSGMGKSAFMCGVSRYAAQHGFPTIVFSLEMTCKEWTDRLICDLDFDTAPYPMSYSKVGNLRMSDDEFSRFLLASQSTDGWPFELHDEDDLTIAQISARARAFAAKYGRHEDGSPKIGLVVIDYLQIINAIDDRENRERQVARIARGAKALAKKLGWPVMIGSQMNEADTQRAKEERRPQASDARESRGIMNEADLMLAPYRPAHFIENRKPMDATYGDPEYESWAAELRAVAHRLDLLCLKNRHGRRVDWEFYCDMSSSSVRDEAPLRHRAPSPEDQAAADLLAGV